MRDGPEAERVGLQPAPLDPVAAVFGWSDAALALGDLRAGLEDLFVELLGGDTSRVTAFPY